MGLGRPRCGRGYRPIVSHTPNTTTRGVEVAANIGVTEAIVRGVAVTPSKTDNRSRVILIAISAAAIVLG